LVFYIKIITAKSRENILDNALRVAANLGIKIQFAIEDS